MTMQCLVALTIAAVTANSLPATAVRETAELNAAAPSITSANLFVPIARSSTENRGLFVVVDSRKQQFTIAECFAPPADGDPKPGSCALLMNAWQPTSQPYADAFDRALNDAILVQNDRLKIPWTVGGTVLNVGLSSFVSAVVAFPLLVIASDGDGFSGRGLGIVGGVWAITLAGLEYRDYQHRRARTIESDLIRFQKSADGRVVIVPPDEVAERAALVYAALKQSLAVAMATGPIL